MSVTTLDIQVDVPSELPLSTLDRIKKLFQKSR